MKKKMLFIGSLMVCGILFFTACETTDLTAPVISITGNGEITIDLGDVYTDQGATAQDNKDGNITSHIVVTGIPQNTYLCGTYNIKYTVTDKAGNQAEATRVLKIKSDKLAGTYSVVETKFQATVRQSSDTYNKIYIDNFGNYTTSSSNPLTMEALVDGTHINLVTQTFTDNNSTSVTLSGSGEYTGPYNGLNFKITRFDYVEHTPGNTDTTYHAVYSKQ